MHPQNSGQTRETQLISQTGKVRIHTKTHRVPRGRTGKQHHSDGPNQNKRSRRMATPKEPHRCPLILRFHRILSLLHPKLLVCRKTLVRLNEESDTMDLDRSSNKGFRDIEDTDVLKTRTNPATVRQTLRSPYRRIGLWRGHHTLTRGRNQPPKTFKTTSSPHCLL